MLTPVSMSTVINKLCNQMYITGRLIKYKNSSKWRGDIDWDDNGDFYD